LRRTGEQEIARLKRERLGYMLDLRGNIEDHVAGIAVLAQLAVDPALERLVGDVASFVRRGDPWTDRRVGVEPFAHDHGLAGALPVADGVVAAGHVAANDLVRPLA